MYFRAINYEHKIKMDNFIIEEFTHYKVSLFGRNTQGEKTDYGIQFKIASGRVVLRFSRDLNKANEVLDYNGSKVFVVYLRVEKYPAFIDIMRNEGPLFFYYNLDSNQSYITTTNEPVGEGEASYAAT